MILKTLHILQFHLSHEDIAKLSLAKIYKAPQYVVLDFLGINGNDFETELKKVIERHHEATQLNFIGYTTVEVPDLVSGSIFREKSFDQLKEDYVNLCNGGSIASTKYQDEYSTKWDKLRETTAFDFIQ